MQRKYNMALQHFYEAATHSPSNENDELKTKLRNLSGSEEDVFNISEKHGGGSVSEGSGGSKEEENNYFTYDKEMSVKRIKPVSICSWRGSALFCIWCVLFIIGVVGISYCLQIAITRIPDRLKSVHKLPRPHSKSGSSGSGPAHNYTTPCTDFSVEKIWSKTFPKARASSPLRVVDVDGDGVDDILFGFSTNLGDGPFSTMHQHVNKAKQTCKKFHNGTYPCFGGVAAVNGATGEQLWVHRTTHGVTSIICNGDINADGYADCLCSGHGELLHAISSKTGALLWSFRDKHVGYARRIKSDFGQPQFVNDLDGDGVLDVLQFRGGHEVVLSNPTHASRSVNTLFISGRTGKVLKVVPLSPHKDLHSSPVVYLGENNVAKVVFGTGDANTSGGLYVIPLRDLYEGSLNHTVEVISDKRKGFPNAPVLVDLNADGTVDIVSAGAGGKIHAIDGKSFKILFTYYTSGTETFSTPAPGYFNDDNIVDFMVRVNTGPEAPVYYDSKMVVLDGKTGLPLTTAGKTSVPTHTSPLSVSMEGVGNDLAVYWSTDCAGHEHEGGWFKFVQGTDVDASFKSDSCYGRFGVGSRVMLNVMSAKGGFPGKTVYISDGENNLLREDVMTGAVIAKGKRDGDLDSSFDVVFVTSSVIPTKVRVLTPDDIECIKENTAKFKTSGKASAKKSGVYDEGDAVTNFCLSKRLPGETYDDPKKRDANFNKGHATVHRYKLTCKGEDSVRVLPKTEQGWSQHMGSMGNSYFNRRPTGRLLRNE